MKYFGPCRLDTRNECLWRDGVQLSVPPKPYAVLLYLVEHAGRLVTHDELMEALWPETYVQPQVLRTYVLELRRMLGDDAGNPQFIATVPKRGYRFVAAVSDASGGADGASRETGGAKSTGAGNGDPGYPHSQGASGRDTELEKLENLMGRARRGERQIVFITGEPGMGKSTLVDALCRDAAAVVAHGQSIEGFGSKEHYYAVKEILSELCGSEKGEEHLRLLERLAPSWHGLLAQFAHRSPHRGAPAHAANAAEHPGPAHHSSPANHGGTAHQGGRPDSRTAGQKPSGTGSGLQSSGQSSSVTPGSTAVDAAEAERPPEKALLTEICGALEAMAQAAALLLVFEDLQWADEATLDVFSALARRRGAAKLMVIATYRPGEMKDRQHPLRALKQDLTLRRLCTVIDLQPLSKIAVADYLAQQLAARLAAAGASGSAAAARAKVVELPDGLAALVHQQSGGNPLFVAAMLDHMIQQRSLVASGDGWKLRGPLETLDIGVPDGVCEKIEFEVEVLDEEDQRLLEAGSIVGTVFPVWAAAEVLGAGRTEPEEAYETLARRVHFLHAAGHDELPDGTRSTSYVFAHSFYREVLYHRQAEVRRSRGHLRVAEGLGRIFAGSEISVAAEIAAHFEAAGDWARAARTRAGMGEDFAARNSVDDGVQHLQRAIELLENLGVRERAPLEKELRRRLAEMSKVGKRDAGARRDPAAARGPARSAAASKKSAARAVTNVVTNGATGGTTGGTTKAGGKAAAKVAAKVRTPSANGRASPKKATRKSGKSLPL